MSSQGVAQFFLIRFFKVILVAFFLSGCQSTYRAIERYEEDVNRQKAERALREKLAIQNKCLSFGIRLNTPQMSDCIMKITIAKEQQDAVDEERLWRQTQDLLKPWGPPAGYCVNCR